MIFSEDEGKTMTFRNSIVWLAAAAIVLAGCASESKPEEKTGTEPAKSAQGVKPKKSSYKITIIGKSSTNPVFLSAHKGAQDAAAELGKKYGVKVDIDIATPTTEDGQQQAQKIAEAKNNGSDAILISCSDASKVNNAINDAVGAGVEVMTFDSDAPDSKRFAFYGADDTECGQMVMDELAKVTGGKGNFAVLAGNQNAPNLVKRAKAAIEQAKAKYPDMKYVNTFYHPETPQDASQAVTAAMNANPQIDSWAMIGGWPLFAKSLLTLDPAKVKIVAVDALPQELGYVDKGVAPVLLAQPCYKWGYEGVRIILEKIVEGKAGQQINKMPLEKVTKENLGKWANQLKEWGFKDVEQKYLDMK